MHPMQLLALSFCLWIDVDDVVMTNGLASIVVALHERMTTRITANANIVAMVDIGCCLVWKMYVVEIDGGHRSRGVIVCCTLGRSIDMRAQRLVMYLYFN